MKDIRTLKRILWADALLGGGTALIGVSFFNQLTPMLGLPTNLILIISGITFLYAVIACILATQKPIRIPLLRTLVSANWVWTTISMVLLFLYYRSATVVGLAFLILQVIVVGGLAYAEAGQILKHRKSHP